MDPAEHPSFASLLKAYRLARGLSQGALAERAGLSPDAISLLERGLRLSPRRDTVSLLAKTLKLSPDERARLLAAATPRRGRTAVDTRAASGPPSSLPLRLTSFIGREQAIAEVQELFRSKRLLTLTGPGGIGKTSLALAVAAGTQPHFDDGVSLVELASLTDGELVPNAVAAAVGVREQRGEPVLSTLVTALGTDQRLLVLDNCEHLLLSCAQVAEALLRACPRLRILATSREPLRVGAEAIWRVPSLTLPAIDPQPLDEIARSEAVRLFVERAEAIRSGFALTLGNAVAVAEICRRLDGIPLAIELAAARVTALTPEQIARHLNDRFRFLTTGSRTALPRHRTLRAMIAWSYDLLTPGEQTLLRRLAVFDGGFTLEAAEAIASGDDAGPVDVLNGLTSLVDKSLLAQQEQPDGEPRFVLLETIRAFGLEQLVTSGEVEASRRKHARYVVTLAERAKVPDADFGLWLVRLDLEHANVRAAFAWCRAHDEIAWQARLVAALGWWWLQLGHVAEVRAWADETVAATVSLGVHPLRAGVLHSAALIAYNQGDLLVSQAWLGESLALWHQLTDERGIAWAQVILSNIARDQGDHAQARALAQASLAGFQTIGDQWAEAYAITRLGMLAVATGEHATARDFHERGLAIFRALGDDVGVATALGYLGTAARARGDLAEAARLFAESLTRSRDLRWNRGFAERVAPLAGLAVATGDWERAGRLVGATVARLQGSGGGRLMPSTRAAYERDLARLRLQLGEEAFAQKVVEGRAMSLNAVIAEGLAVARGATCQVDSASPDRLTEREVEVLSFDVAD